MFLKFLFSRSFEFLLSPILQFVQIRIASEGTYMIENNS